MFEIILGAQWWIRVVIFRGVCISVSVQSHQYSLCVRDNSASKINKPEAKGSLLCFVHYLTVCLQICFQVIVQTRVVLIIKWFSIIIDQSLSANSSFRLPFLD